jgi:hypothetical protein
LKLGTLEEFPLLDLEGMDDAIGSFNEERSPDF